jgi:RHS repeat-associated protein
MAYGLRITFLTGSWKNYIPQYLISTGSNFFLWSWRVSQPFAWTGEELTSIADAKIPANSETFTYTPSHRLASATGAYGTLAWTYDANGNRATQVAGSASQAYAYPATSNQLSSIAAAGAATRSFAYDASGNRVSDTTGPSVLGEQYDGHGRLSTFESGSTTEGTYAYDAFARLVQRVASNVSPSGTTQYLYDEFGHVILETDGAGNSLREYIWLDDMPIGVIDQVNTASPVLYYVHADHLNRPIMVTNGAQQSVWTATWTPFGPPLSATGPLTYDARFPGQWFQIESGLNWNWNRHYDPSTGRYVQPDPFSTLMRDQTQAGALAGAAGFAGNLVRGFNDAVARSAVGQVNGAIGGQTLPAAPGVGVDLLEPLGDPTRGNILANAVFPDRPSRYGYARNAPLLRTDARGLASGLYTPKPPSSSAGQQMCLLEESCVDHYVRSPDKYG